MFLLSVLTITFVSLPGCFSRSRGAPAQQVLHPLVRGLGGSLALCKAGDKEYSTNTWCRTGAEAEHYRWPSPSLPPTLKKGLKDRVSGGPGQVISGHRTKVKINNSDWGNY